MLNDLSTHLEVVFVRGPGLMIFKPAFANSSRHFLQLVQFILEVKQLLSRFSTDVRLSLTKWKTSCPPSVPQLLLSTNFFQKLIFMSFNATFPVDPYGQSRNLKALYLLSDLSLNPLDQLCPWPGASLKQFLLRICRIFNKCSILPSICNWKPGQQTVQIWFLSRSHLEWRF